MSNPSYDVDDILNEVRKRREEQEAEIKGAADEKKTSKPAEKPHNNGKNAENASVGIKNEQPEKKERVQTIFAEKKANDSAEVDLFSLSDSYEDPEPLKKSKAEKEKAKKKKKKLNTAARVCIVIAVLAIIAGIAAVAIHYNNLLDNATNTPDPVVSTEEWHGMDNLVEDFTPITEDSAKNISSYKDMVKKWYYNGTPVSSTHVLNVLLIGEDTRDEEVIDEETRADSAIIASVNVDTGEIILTSILRDAYCYWETVEGDKKSGKYGKINESMMSGGIDCYIRTVEHMYKINIDNYVIVNFSSFENIINTLGGVDVEMTQKEINEINNHQKRYDHVRIDGEPGLLHLRGDEAIAYCRIRKIDSDGARADRQKTVLLQLFKKAKESSSIKVVEVVSELLPYVKTGFSKKEIISIAKYALSHGWLQYQTQTYTIPNDEGLTDAEGKAIKGCVGGTFYGAWIWKVDFPLYSQITQQRIYGKTNITLSENRPKFDKLK